MTTEAALKAWETRRKNSRVPPPQDEVAPRRKAKLTPTRKAMKAVTAGQKAAATRKANAKVRTRTAVKKAATIRRANG